MLGHPQGQRSALQFSVQNSLDVPGMLLVSQLPGTSGNFLIELQLQWILNIICPMRAIRYLFQQPSDSSIQRRKKCFPQSCGFFALLSSNKLILWCSSICSSFLSVQSRLEDSLADLVFWDVEGIGLRVRSNVISIIGYFCISSVDLCYYYKTV